MADNLWAAIETEISPDQCEMYSYSGDAMSDPFSAEGALWSFVYFFYNRHKRRVVLFACCGFRYAVISVARSQNARMGWARSMLRRPFASRLTTHSDTGAHYARSEVDASGDEVMFAE